LFSEYFKQSGKILNDGLLHVWVKGEMIKGE